MPVSRPLRRLAGAIILALPLLLAVNIPAQADEETRLATELVDIVTDREQILKAATLLLNSQVSGDLKKNYPDQTDLIDREIDQLVLGLFDTLWPDVRALAILFYARSMSADDLRTTIAYYRTPAGEKMIKLMPVATILMSTFVQQKKPQMMRDVQSRMKAIVSKLEANR